MSDNKMDAVTARPLWPSPLAEQIKELVEEKRGIYPSLVEIGAILQAIDRLGYHITPIAPPQGELLGNIHKFIREKHPAANRFTAEIIIADTLSYIAAQGLRVVCLLDVVAGVCQAVVELPDRTSSDDASNMLLVTRDELQQVVTNELNEAAYIQTPTTETGSE